MNLEATNLFEAGSGSKKYSIATTTLAGSREFESERPGKSYIALQTYISSPLLQHLRK